MRLLRPFFLLLVMIAPAAFADGTYQVEMILFRQIGEPAAPLQYAPENWAADAQRITAANERGLALSDLANKLSASGNYQILLHRAWLQDLTADSRKMAVSSGQEQFGHFPIEGTLSLGLSRFTDIAADFWVNRLDEHGVLLSSERMNQTTRVKNGELTFMDNGSLAMLVKVSPQ